MTPKNLIQSVLERYLNWDKLDKKDVPYMDTGTTMCVTLKLRDPNNDEESATYIGQVQVDNDDINTIRLYSLIKSKRKKAYVDLSKDTDEEIHDKFIEMFGEYAKGKTDDPQ